MIMWILWLVLLGMGAVGVALGVLVGMNDAQGNYGGGTTLMVAGGGAVALAALGGLIQCVITHL
jgi:hypothetical protein